MPTILNFDEWQQIRSAALKNPLSKAPWDYHFPKARKMYPNLAKVSIAQLLEKNQDCFLMEVAMGLETACALYKTACLLANREPSNLFPTIHLKTNRPILTLQDLETLASFEKEIENVDAAQWQCWRASLIESEWLLKPIKALAQPLALYWPENSTRLLYDMWRLDYDTFIHQPGIGPKKQYTLLMLMYLYANYHQLDAMVRSQEQALKDPIEPIEAQGVALSDHHKVISKDLSMQIAAIQAHFTALKQLSPSSLKTWKTSFKALIDEIIEVLLESQDTKEAAYKRDQVILQARLLQSLTLEEIGQQLDLTRERVRQRLVWYEELLINQYSEWLSSLVELDFMLWSQQADISLRRFFYIFAAHLCPSYRAKFYAPDQTLAFFLNQLLKEAKKEGKTPMPLHDFIQMVQKQVPALPTHIIEDVLLQENLLALFQETFWVYGSGLNEVLHRILLSADTPQHLQSLVEQTNAERSLVHSWLMRDKRFIQNEAQNWSVKQKIPIRVLQTHTLQIEVKKIGTSSETLTVSLDELCLLVHERLRQIEVYNVTPHGFYRCCQELLLHYWDAQLPVFLDPVILGQLITDHTQVFAKGGKRRLTSRYFPSKASVQDAGYWLEASSKACNAVWLKEDMVQTLGHFYQDASPSVHAMWFKYYKDKLHVAECIIPNHGSLHFFYPLGKSEDVPLSNRVKQQLHFVAQYPSRYRDLSKQDFAALPQVISAILSLNPKFPWQP